MLCIFVHTIFPYIQEIKKNHGLVSEKKKALLCPTYIHRIDRIMFSNLGMLISIKLTITLGKCTWRDVCKKIVL